MQGRQCRLRIRVRSPTSSILTKLTRRRERKKSHDKVYPKGYVEMLEQQQGQLVSGLQEMYRRLVKAHVWTGPSLDEDNGYPLTHDILTALNLLESKHDGSGEVEVFEEDCRKLESKLLAEGASFIQRRVSFSSDSDHSQHNDHPHSGANGGHTRLGSCTTFRDGFSFQSASPPSLPRSPAQQQQTRQPFQQAQPSPLQQSSPLSNDPQLYQAEWSIPDMSSPELLMRSRFAMQAPTFQQNMSQVDEALTGAQLDMPMMWNDASCGGMSMSFPQQFSNTYSDSMQGMQDFGVADAQDLEFSRFIQPPASVGDVIG